MYSKYNHEELKTMLKNKRPLVIVGYAVAIAAIVFSLVTLYNQYVPAPEEGATPVS